MTIESVRPQIDEALFRGAKVQAIKIYRDAMGGELLDAKRAVERIEAELRKSRPEYFRRRPSSSAPVVPGEIVIRLVAIVIAAAALAWVLLN